MKHPLLISSFALAASVSAACSDFETGDLQGTVGKADFAERRAEAAVRELGAKFPSYPAAAFLGRLAQLRAEKASRAALDDFLKAALVRANPLVNAHEIVYTTRDMWAQDHHNTATLFQCGEVNQNSYRTQGALKALDVKSGAVRVIVPEVAGRTVRDPEVDYDGRRIVFSMRAAGAAAATESGSSPIAHFAAVKRWSWNSILPKSFALCPSAV